MIRACLFLACAMGVSAPALADDGGDDAGTEAGAGGSGAGGACTADSSGGEPTVQMTCTPNNLGCSAAPAPSGSAGTLAGLAIVGAAVWARRRRAAGVLAASALSVVALTTPARADTPPAAPPTAPAPAAAPAAAPPSLYTADAAPPAEKTAPVRFGFGATITTDFYGAPVEIGGQPKGQSDALGIGAFVELGRGEDAGVWAPLVRLTGARASIDATGGMSTAIYTWYTLAADFCPIQASLAHGLWVRPCARVTGGLLTAATSFGNQAYGAQEPWVSAGLLARLQWRPVGPLFFEAQGGAAYAFTHDTLTVGPSTAPMNAIPTLTPASFEPFGALGVGLTFP